MDKQRTIQDIIREGLASYQGDKDMKQIYRENMKRLEEQKAVSAHYDEMPIEPWDVLDTWPIEQQIGYHRGNILKYTMRMGLKDDRLKEAKKIQDYAEKLVDVLGG
jgi:hypothetical protein